MLTEKREEIPCMMCGTLTPDQWGGYCHDCDSYFEAVILDQQLGYQQDDQANLIQREVIKEMD